MAIVHPPWLRSRPRARRSRSKTGGIMKSALVALAMAVFATPAVAYVGLDNNPTIVPTKLAKTYVPDGFDDNDNVQFVAEGVFPSGCYRFAKMEVAVDHENRTIKLSPTAYKYNQCLLMVLLPFDRVVDVGLLKKGDYKILLEPNDQPLGQ